MTNFFTVIFALAQSPLLIFMAVVTVLVIVGTLVLGWWTNKS
jgi:hypothetical protein